MEKDEWESGLEVIGCDVICECGVEFQTDIKPSYCCDGKDCGCYGKDQNIYTCNKCLKERSNDG